jgi:hypothetical protein
MSRSGQKHKYSQVIAMTSVLLLVSISLVNPSRIIHNIFAQDEELTATESPKLMHGIEGTNSIKTYQELSQPLEAEGTTMNSIAALESASLTKNNGLVQNDAKDGTTEAGHSNLPTMPSIATSDRLDSNIAQSITALQ